MASDRGRQFPVLPGHLIGHVGFVAAEQLVASVSAEGYGNVFPGQTGDQEGGENGKIADGIVQKKHQSVKEVHHLGLNNLLPVVQTEMIGHLTGPPQFVVGGIIEADAEGLSGSHAGGHQGRVDPAGEKGPQRHVAHQLPLNGDPDLLFHPLDPGRFLQTVFPGPRDIPVKTGFAARGPQVDLHQAAGFQLANGFQQGGPSGHVFPGQKFPQGLQIQGPFHPTAGQNGFDLRAPDQVLPVKGKIQGFDAQVIADEAEGLLPRIMEGDGEHAVQDLGEIRPVLFITVDDNLRVAMGLEAMPPPLQIPSQFSEVVNLAVENRPHRPVFIENRLAAAG